MTVTKECYADLQEKYEKVKKLIEEDSKLDSTSEPYTSKYNAKQLLIGMKANIENLLRSQTPGTKEFLKLTGMLATVFLYLGRIAIETEETSTGEKFFKKCVDVIDKEELKPEIVIITLHILNELGLFWAEREPTKSKLHLEKCEQSYKQFKESEAVPTDFDNLFHVDPVADEITSFTNLEKAHTLTLYYLAQIYGTLGDALKSAIYCHTTLKRQLEMNDYDHIDWALNAATLSQFFMEKNGFKQARHHLAASSYILDVYKKELDECTLQNDEYYAKVENFKHRSADVARCWAKYGLLLLSSSRDRLMNHEDIDTVCALSTDLAKLDLTNMTLSSEDIANLEFRTLALSDQERQITDQFLLTFKDAREVFLNAKTWLEKAHNYYTLNSLASDYIEIMQDQAQLYLNLLFFEDNPENQAKMHKRRIDLMENVLNEINPTYYMQYCKQLWFELAQTYSEILYIKLDKLKESIERPNPNTLTKINNFIDKGIVYNNKFIDSFRDVVTKNLPDRIPEQYEKPYLKAIMANGALHGRYIVLDKEINLQHVQASLEYYKKVLDYCQTNPEVKEVLPTEHSICTEMTTLLPVKIQKLKQEIPLSK
uniref:KIF-binding protein n=1 Tax=Photinus pyralis TaxID=7054 RepID=A0A1Y1K409_PHOPY